LSLLLPAGFPIIQDGRQEISRPWRKCRVLGGAMTMHLAVQILDGARSAKYGPALSRYGIVHPCDSGSDLDSAVAGGAAVAVLELGNPDDAETFDVLVGLRQEHPGLCLIVLYEPAGEELREAVKLAQRRLGLWFACGTDAELDLLFARVAAGRLPATPTPAEVAVACVAELSPGPARDGSRGSVASRPQVISARRPRRLAVVRSYGPSSGSSPTSALRPARCAGRSGPFMPPTGSGATHGTRAGSRSSSGGDPPGRSAEG
jgi:hypothetical protein